MLLTTRPLSAICSHAFCILLKQVDNNSFTGTLPNSMAKWNNLLGILMGDNSFTGTLPDGLEAWSSVINFSLRNTNMTGTLPETIGRWVQLHGFDVSCGRVQQKNHHQH